jgi:peptide/nickel transport system substrate-binding protein
VVRHFRTRAYAAVAGAVALTMLAAACSSSSTSGNGGGNTQQNQLTAGWQGLNPGSGAPQRGGTLNMVGVSDVNYMDYDFYYYTSDIQVMRMLERGLYGWPAVPNKNNTVPAPDLATGMPVASDNGLTQTITIRSDVMWNSTPPRPVTAADVVRGLKRACNPTPASFGGIADFESTIKGLTEFCTGYPAKAATDATVMKQYIEGHNISGVTTSGNTITFSLTRPAPWLVGAMTLGAFAATPVEALNGLPNTPAVYNHLLSSGPYQLTSYTPKKSIQMTRNPQWKASTDPLRKAYVDAINIDETGNQTTIYQQMPTGSASLGMTFDSLPPPANFPNMINQIKSGSHNVNLGATYSSNPYLLFNLASPNNGGALSKVEVRQALSYGMERSQFQKVLGGPIIIPALTHVLPDGIDGSQDVPKGYNPYPYNPGKAKSMLAAAGFTASHQLQIKFLYRSDSQGQTALFNNVSTQLSALGSVKVIGVPTNQSDFYAKYLYAPNSKSSPSPAYKGVWDMSCPGWGPDWYGNSAVSFFNPLYSSPGGYPANGGSNFGYFSSATVNSLINQALSQPTEDQADKIWAQADQQVMKEAAFYPITSELQLAEHAPYVHNAVYMTQWQNFDPTNVWLSKPGG